MRKDNRKFCASISVRNGEERAKLELSPAPLHGGPEGFYRVRLAADGFYEGTWTNTEPILDYTGRWVVNVSLGGKRVFVPVEEVTVHKERRRG